MRPVVVTRLMGGLGNQMFQYAAGLALATRHGVPLLVDRSFLDAREAGQDHTIRDFELDVFGFELRIASDEERRALVRRGRRTLLRRIAAHLPGVSGVTHLREGGPRYQPAFETARPPVYLDGFWQCERYFERIAAELRARFVPAAPIDARNGELLARIRSCTSVSVHVRRADYVSNPGASSFHGVCSVDYYQRAAALVAGRTERPHFFLFSDDPAWVAEHLRLPYPSTHVAHNHGRDACWDLHLMRSCKHHVVANSSFSWWGAWLNPDPGKIVIAPKVWFQALGEDGTDIVPSTWTRL